MSYFSTIYASDLPSRARTLYMYLKDRSDKNGACFPAIKTIARDTGLSGSTVKRAISDLEHAGLLQKKQRWRENGGRSSLLFEINS